MGTGSYIIQATTEGDFKGVRVHWDGYPEGVGHVLLNHYTEDEKVSQLIDMGYMSSLAPEIGEKHEYGTKMGEECDFYHRDMGRALWVDCFETAFDVVGFVPEKTDVDFLYIWTGQKWYVCRVMLRYGIRSPKELTADMCGEVA